MFQNTTFFKKLLVLRLIGSLIIFFVLPAVYHPNVQAANTGFNDRFFGEQKYLEQINYNLSVPSVAGHLPSPEEKNIVVAIIDEGVDFTHPDLQTALWSNLRESADGVDNDGNGFTDDVHGWNFYEQSNNLSSRGPHGTRLAGIIAARANNNEGVAGLAQNAKIMPLIACDALYGCNLQAITAAIFYAADNGADIINLSFGDIAGYSEVYTPAVNYASQKGVIVVAAAGGIDAGFDLSHRPISPVCNEPVIGVSSVDETGQLPAWANFGSCVDVYAPGTNIFTATDQRFDGNLYGYFNGSSYSTAIVSGWAALLKAVKPDISFLEITTLIKNQRLDIEASLLSFAPKPKAVAKVKGANIIKKQNKPIAVKIATVWKPKEKFR